MVKTYLPTNDYAFRSLFGSPNNLEVTAGFLRDFFGEEVKPGDIQLLKNEVIDKVAFAKLDEGAQSELIETIRDITLEILPAKITIEMQVIREPNFIKRALHYLTRLYVDSYGSDSEAPDKRAALKPVWSMNVLAHKRFLHDAEPYRLFALRDEVTAELLEKNPLRLGFFEISKQLELQVPSGSGSLPARRTAWAYFLVNGTAPKNAPAYIELAESIMVKMNADPMEAMMLSAAEKARDDRLASEYWARMEGRDERDAEMVMDMFRNDEPFEKIVKYSKLPLEQLKELQSVALQGGN